MNDIKQ